MFRTLRFSFPFNSNFYFLRTNRFLHSSFTKLNMFKVNKSNEEWKTILTPEEYRVLREGGTEPSGTGKYDKFYKEGTYMCAGCKTPLYTSETKFKSGCGWPAFYDAIPDAVGRRDDKSFGMIRTEIFCRTCGGHLGHVFKGEGYSTPTDERHCVNSISLNFKEKK